MFEKAIIWLRRHFWLGDSEELAEVAVQLVVWCENTRKENEVVSGAFVYYIVEEGTNVRRSVDGVPVIYSVIDIADYICNWSHEEVISVAAYNRMYGRFMVDDGVWYKTY